MARYSFAPEPHYIFFYNFDICLSCVFYRPYNAFLHAYINALTKIYNIYGSAGKTGCWLDRYSEFRVNTGKTQGNFWEKLRTQENNSGFLRVFLCQIKYL